jgi:predicted kinase
LIRAGADVADELRSLAKLLATFHASAQRSAEISAEAGAMGLRRRWIDNFTETEPFRGHPLPESVVEEVRRLALQYLDGRDVLFAERASAGRYVDGHGDLSSEDIFCLADHPRVLDCIEFDDQLRWVDVLDDVAFLAMDLEYLGHPDLATLFLDWYAEYSGTPTVATLLHHYIAYRAVVRAKVAAIRAQQGVTLAAAGADRHLRVALHHLQIGRVTFALVGGAPGTGKTTLAHSLADELGWMLLSSDGLRAPAADPYSAAAKAATYQELLTHARQALERGESVVADATWADPEMRALAEDVASATASRLIALECQAPIEVAAVRAENRLQAGNNSSQAGAVIARELATARQPWPNAIAIDTNTDISDAVQQALTAIGLPRGRPTSSGDYLQ